MSRNARPKALGFRRPLGAENPFSSKHGGNLDRKKHRPVGIMLPGRHYGTMRNKTLFSTALAIALVAMTCLAHAGQNFDRPFKHIHVPSTKPYSGDGVDCIYYSDVMIYIPGTDGPEPGNATIVSNPAHAKCSRTPPSAGILMKTDGYYLRGRDGRFLIFFYTDWIDFESFKILDVQNGHTLYQDGILRDFSASGLTRGVLHLHYTRGVALTCSVMSDPYKCWSEALATGRIPRGALSGPPSLANCKANYYFPGSFPRSATDPEWKFDETDPSVIYYDVDVSLGINGKVMIRPMGNLRCAARQ